MTNIADGDGVDLGPEALGLGQLVTGAPDELDAPTPCPSYSVGDLIDHVGGLAIALTIAARTSTAESGSQGPSADASRLGDGWRMRVPQDLGSLAEAWRDSAAWSGTTEAGGLELPAEVAGLAALNELVVHGWDLARATGQGYDCEPVPLEAVYAFLDSFSAATSDEQREGSSGLWSRCRATHRWSLTSWGSAVATRRGPRDVTDDGAAWSRPMGAPPGIRTRNLWIKSPLLCH
jgi:uncharacterized protein (TIGR03086 family)